jgi:hypothetical protein
MCTLGECSQRWGLSSLAWSLPTRAYSHALPKENLKLTGGLDMISGALIESLVIIKDMSQMEQRENCDLILNHCSLLKAAAKVYYNSPRTLHQPPR